MNATDHRHTLTQLVKRLALDAGFDLAGVAPATAGLGSEKLTEWLAAGKHGEMAYMDRQQAARGDPNRVLDGVRSVVVVALSYRTTEPASPQPGQGRISRYAWGRDYHDVIHERLHQTATRLHETRPEIRSRAVVDSAPLMERDYGRLAGLGWFGKNTLLLNQRLGSYFLLGALLLDVELDYDAPMTADHCGSCRACLDACPTQAFDGPYQLDPRRCISYLTIEHKAAIPESIRSRMGDWFFGCDVCQEVCPWNGKATTTNDPAFRPASDANPASLGRLLGMTEPEFRARFRGTPLFRTGRSRVVRNAVIVAGNQRYRELLPQLCDLLGDPDNPLREAAAWAIARIEGDENPAVKLRMDDQQCVQTK